MVLGAPGRHQTKGTKTWRPSGSLGHKVGELHDDFDRPGEFEAMFFFGFQIYLATGKPNLLLGSTFGTGKATYLSGQLLYLIGG